MYELTQRERKYRQEQRDYGFQLYAAYQPVTLCTNDYQRAGWHEARRGEMACAFLDTTAFLVQQGAAR